MNNLPEWNVGEGEEASSEMVEKRLFYIHLQQIIEEDYYFDNQNL